MSIRVWCKSYVYERCASFRSPEFSCDWQCIALNEYVTVNFNVCQPVYFRFFKKQFSLLFYSPSQSNFHFRFRVRQKMNFVL
jgi:hypothetical protein